MAAALEDTSVTYEDLADIEKDFDDVETEIIKQQVALTAPLYTRRDKTVSQIPNFWPLVLEQAPPDIDQYIQPSDSALLLSSLAGLSVSHFELTQQPEGDPRSVSIKWTFTENEYFEDTVLEKKFWHRKGKDGWSGLVSEPVPIKWKKGKDLTGGLLDLVCKSWEAGIKEPKDKSKGPTAAEKALKKQIESTGMGGLSFFAWFGFIGQRISKEESDDAKMKEAERRTLRKSGQEVSDEPEAEDEDDDEDDELSLEIFPEGDDLAVAIAEDLWPGAIRYFTQAQEQDALSDADFESDDEELAGLLNADSENEDSDSERPSKKQKH